MRSYQGIEITVMRVEDIPVRLGSSSFPAGFAVWCDQLLVLRRNRCCCRRVLMWVVGLRCC